MRAALAMSLLIATAVLSVSSITILAPTSAAAQDTPHPSQSFDPHNLSGVWDHPGPTRGDKVPPMTAWGQAKFNANKPSFGPRQVPPAFGNDPIGKCDPQGFPRMNTFENPEAMEFVQLPGRVLQFIEWNHAWRTIWTDGRPLPKDHDPLWYGYSVGKWDGNAFVVDTVALNDSTWLDRFGDPHSDELHVQERYERLDHDTLDFTMTIDDPKTYMQTWALVRDKKLKLNPTYELDEDVCAPSTEEIFNEHVRNPAAGITQPK